jgi:hypothetical protein
VPQTPESDPARLPSATVTIHHKICRCKLFFRWACVDGPAGQSYDGRWQCRQVQGHPAGRQVRSQRPIPNPDPGHRELFRRPPLLHVPAPHPAAVPRACCRFPVPCSRYPVPRSLFPVPAAYASGSNGVSSANLAGPSREARSSPPAVVYHPFVPASLRPSIVPFCIIHWGILHFPASGGP